MHAPQYGMMKLPYEILLLVVEELEFSSLAQVSIANKFLNQLSNPRLWQHFSLHDDHGGHELSSQKKLKMIISGCSAIRRDPQRATCIKSLSIRILQKFSERTWGSSGVISHIRDALLILPSLRHIDLYIPDQPVDLPIFQMLSTSAPELPFRLLEIRLSLPLRLPLSGFLESQDSVEILHVVWVPDAGNQRDWLDTSHLLPRVHWQEVPLYAVKEFITGRHLQSLNLEGFVNERYQDLWTPNPSSSDEVVDSLVVVHEIYFTWAVSERFDHQLLPFLTSQCGISLLAINSLFIQSHRWPNQTSFPDVVFWRTPESDQLRMELHPGESLGRQYR